MFGKNKNIKKIKWDFYSISCAILAGLFFVQLLICFWFNICKLGGHVGYDSSWPILKSMLVWKEGSLNSPMWSDQTGIYYDSAILLASVFFGITKNILLSYGLANMVILTGILAAAYAVMKTMGIRAAGILTALNMIVCPYLTNGFDLIDDLGYFSSVISGPAFYAGRALTMLIVVLTFFTMGKKYNIYLMLCSFLLCILSGMSVGIFLIVVLAVPLMLYIIERALIKNEIRVFFDREAFYLYGTVFSVMAGKVIGKKIFPIQTIDEIRTWTAIDHIFINIGAVLQGFMKLLGPLPVADGQQVNILTKEGLAYLFPLCIFAVVLIAVFIAVGKVKKDFKQGKTNDRLLLLVNIVFGNIVIFSLFNVQYGSYLFEERYLVIAFMAVILITAYVVDQLDHQMLYSRLLILMLIVGFAGTNMDSDIKYKNTTNDIWQIRDIQACISELDSELVYVWGDSLSTVGRDLRVLDLSRVYKCISSEGNYDHWGDYLYFEQNEDYSGQTVLLCPKAQDVVPDYILAKYKLYREFEVLDVYICDSNPIDLHSGITTAHSIDYPYSPGMCMTDAAYDAQGNFVIDASEDGYKLWGPYTATVSGNYDFTLYYEVLKEGKAPAVFDVLVSGENGQQVTIDIPSDADQVTISNVSLPDANQLEYRVFASEGSKILIKSIEINKN